MVGQFSRRRTGLRRLDGPVGFSMDQIRLSCGNCGRELLIASKFVGRNGKCPACGLPFTVPVGSPAAGISTANSKPMQIADTPRQRPKSSVSPRRARIAAPFQSRRRRVLAAIAGTSLVPLLIWWINVKDRLFIDDRASAPNNVDARQQDRPTWPASSDSDPSVQASRVALPNPGVRQAPDLESVVDHELEPTSEQYTDAGFQELTFGMSRTAIEGLKGRLEDAQQIRGWLTDAQRHLYRFDDADRLHAIIRRYDGNNGAYLDEMRRVFGRTSKDRISMATRVISNQVIVTSSIEYVFPKTFVVIETVDSQTGQISGQQTVFVSMYDRAWLKSILIRQGLALEDALQWARGVVDHSKDGVLDLKSLAGPSGTTAAYVALDVAAEFKWLPNGYGTEAVAFSDERDRVAVFERVLNELPTASRFQRPGSYRLYIAAGRLAAGRIPALDARTNPLFMRLHLAVVQRAFAPEDSDITWKKSADELLKSYEWDTSSG
jgi:hypothetical protein